jgi:peptidyl-tRNA hydrolase, PTH1 family
MTTTAPSPVRLIIGLGNPGAEYAQTRHNIGFLIVDRLAARLQAQFSMEKKWQGHLARTSDGLLLLKPTTYMNLSGESARAVAHFHRILPAQVLVIYDEKDLPFGRLRLRLGGSAAGHNGIKSLIQHLGTADFPRLRFGIGTHSHAPLHRHVLSPFSSEEKADLEKRLDLAADAAIMAIRSGFDRAMNHFNRPESPPPTAPAPRPHSTDPPPPATPS